MSLINLTSIQDGDSADDTLFNSRYGTIVNEINGNLDADNLKDSAVTTPKLANTSVTPVKMNLSKTVDANGWTVYDYGTWKEYHRTGTWGASTIGAGAWANIAFSALPTGMATIGSRHVTISARPSDSAVSVSAGAFNSAAGEIGAGISNQYGGSVTFTIYWSIMIKDA